MLDGIQNDIYEDQALLVWRHKLAVDRPRYHCPCPICAELTTEQEGGDSRGKDQTHNGRDEVRQSSR